LGFLQLDSSLTPAAKRGSNSDGTRPTTKSWDWGKAIGYTERFGEPVHLVDSEARPNRAGAKPPQQSAPAFGPVEQVQSPHPEPAHRPMGVPAPLAKKAKKRARRAKR
jgi:hypothetical protein